MLQITNGILTLHVTDGAFYEFYQACGFEIVGGSKRPEQREEVFTSPANGSGRLEDSPQQRMAEDDSSEDEIEDEDLSEIPLSDMSVEQLKRYADELGISYEGIKYKKDLRNLIKEHLG